ncbi:MULTISPECIES: F0F1 ATP synthase subunit B [unclassified Paenibacillus]|uniref:F0F1 ATP synthase subunit B n=1 Tax=unclassified Paenibacillus TaxID=185978 RepID=UPI0013595B45|nr:MULTISPECIES: F0F1 ATP synthase subunit B [unclassified Paenibacillus]MDR9852407.1 F0F1 ATP synthase subunit B [Paenibacillus sp. VCA1]
MNFFSVTSLPSAVMAFIAFLILYLLLSKYAFGPLYRVMEQREARTKEQLDSADRLREEMQRLEAERKAVLQAAVENANDAVRHTIRESMAQAEQVIKEAKEESNRHVEEALAELEAEKRKAMEAIQGETQDLSSRIVKKLIPERIH